MIFRLAIMRSKSAGTDLIILHECLGHCVAKHKSACEKNYKNICCWGESRYERIACVCVIEHSN